MTPLAPEIPVQKRQSLLATLLGRLQANDTRALPKQAIPEPPPPPAQEKITAFDDRWGAPQKPPVAAVAAEPPPAQEKISAFDDRWGAPAKPAAVAAPVVAAKPVAAPSGDRGKKLSALLERVLRAGRRN